MLQKERERERDKESCNHKEHTYVSERKCVSYKKSERDERQNTFLQPKPWKESLWFKEFE